ncbi:hypothetical protein [Pseudomonas fluorescens]|nr:hypothetical protein [Pseudomonas fluorescens]
MFKSGLTLGCFAVTSKVLFDDNSSFDETCGHPWGRWQNSLPVVSR